ncbi:MAG: hypothetical protein COA78_11960 [Blastopirellula sp.]|nr:MAG: hypothetical protein COA78_11960 [Blastopirellula sp.]
MSYKKDFFYWCSVCIDGTLQLPKKVDAVAVSLVFMEKADKELEAKELDYGLLKIECDNRALLLKSCETALTGRDSKLEAKNHDRESLVSDFPMSHEACDAFWKYWEENGETHKHGHYESTWGAINAYLEKAKTTENQRLKINQDKESKE